MNGALLVDAAGAPLRPAIIWADQRAAAQADLIRARCGEREMYQLTGNRVSPAYTAAKLLWIKEHQPELYRRARWVLQAKDYAAFLFGGVVATDYSDASLTLLLDLASRRWAEPLLDRLQIDAALLPPLCPSAQVIGEVTAAAAAATGLRAGTPVVIGGGDGACATVGAGAVRPSDVYSYIGSSAWVALASAQPVLDPTQRTFNLAHLDPALNVALGAMQTAGGAFDWFERLLRCDREAEPLYAELDAEAAQVPPGGYGLLFLPYLLGERSPHWNPLARGAFVGLTYTHGRGHLARAVMEGGVFALRQTLEICLTLGAPVDQLIVSGGGAESAVWRQIQADVFGLPLRKTLTGEQTSIGAALLAAVGVGLYTTLAEASAATARFGPPTEPNAANHARYNAHYAAFLDLYPHLRADLHRLSTLGGQQTLP